MVVNTVFRIASPIAHEWQCLFRTSRSGSDSCTTS
jgi:hypothetical protein